MVGIIQKCLLKTTEHLYSDNEPVFVECKDVFEIVGNARKYCLYH